MVASGEPVAVKGSIPFLVLPETSRVHGKRRAISGLFSYLTRT